MAWSENWDTNEPSKTEQISLTEVLIAFDELQKTLDTNKKELAHLKLNLKNAQEKLKQKEIEIEAGHSRNQQEIETLQKEWRLTLMKLAPYSEQKLSATISTRIIDAFNRIEQGHIKRLKRETRETLFLGGVYALSVGCILFIGWLTFKGFMG